MLIYNVHESLIVINSFETHFSRNVLKSFNKLAVRVLSRYKTTRLRHVALYPDKTLPLAYKTLHKIYC